jgi:aryl-alcohol dehydrogenase-like predicted oxidoreductase
MLIRQTVLKGSGLKVSRVAMGLSHLHHMRSSYDRDRLIQEARDLGITHFDTAPLYGDGLAERALGRSLRLCRSEVTIATKFGLLPNRWIGDLGVLNWPIRAGRSVLRRLRLVRWPKRCFSVDTFQSNLSASLRALKTDYIDIYFLHEPTLADMEANKGLLAGLIKAKEAGKIRAIGIAGPACGPIVSRFGDIIDVIQTGESDWNEATFVPDLTYGAITGGRAMADLTEPGVNPACASLVCALSRRAEGSVIVGTTKLSHLQQLAEFAANH